MDKNKDSVTTTFLQAIVRATTAIQYNTELRYSLNQLVTVGDKEKSLVRLSS